MPPKNHAPLKNHVFVHPFIVANSMEYSNLGDFFDHYFKRIEIYHHFYRVSIAQINDVQKI